MNKRGHRKNHPLLIVIMDGLGIRHERWGNAVKMAPTPHLDFLFAQPLFRTLLAHGKAVGMPSDKDMGNSEVGHNAIGAGRIFDQGAKLVQEAMNTGQLFQGACWLDLVSTVKNHDGCLHLIGLLSDGNVHSHQNHLYRLCDQALLAGISRIRIHPLLDGRDVPEKSAEQYVHRLEEYMHKAQMLGHDIAVGSGGGRMTVTMDRYEADWQIVERGWRAHVEGVADHQFSSIVEAVQFFRGDENLSDQYFPPFVICDSTGPVGKIKDGDGVILFNFRGDRAIQISQAFTDPDFNKFNRRQKPRVFFAGMMEYDGDAKIPPRYLVAPPLIEHTFSELLADKGFKQFACSETQKFGHVTYFWNGNRSGAFGNLEEFLELPSDQLEFWQKPWMKAYEITEATINRMRQKSFDCARINYANADMVGHTGNFAAAVTAVATVDLMIGRLIETAKQTGITLLITADHGNSDEMLESLVPVKDAQSPYWHSNLKAKTSHTLNPVPLCVVDPLKRSIEWRKGMPDANLGNIANTALDLMGLPHCPDYLPSLTKIKEG